METTLKPYPEYQNSGQGWLGKVPAHWSVLPNRALFREVKDQNHPDEPMLSVTISRGVIPQEVLLADSSKKDSSNLDKSKYKLVVPGDIAYNKMRAWQGSLGVSEHRGIVSPAYIVVRPRQEVDPRYFHYLLRTPAFVKEAERWSYGITSDMWSLRHEDFKQIYCVLPPLDEQRQMACYLDQQFRRVGRLIRAKQRLIALLNEQKQAIIQRAVTRGLDPDVPLKPSGVDWLGDVPAHWEVLPHRAMFREVKDQGYPSEQLLSVTIAHGVITQAKLLAERDTQRDSSNLDKSKYKLVEPGDIAYNKMRAWQGAVGISRYRGIVSPAYIIVRPRHQQEPRFFHYLLRTPSFVKEAERWSYGITSDMWSLRYEDFKLIYSVNPPLEEQRLIADWLDGEVAKLDRKVQEVQAEIDLIREYRTRLIADIVTGKLDVRGVAVAKGDGFDAEVEKVGDLTLDVAEGDLALSTS